MQAPANRTQKVGGALGPTNVGVVMRVVTDRPCGHKDEILPTRKKQTSRSTPTSLGAQGGARTPPGFRP